ncbi:putative disease resistance protein RGA1 [Cocos nucifera]|uniref:Putative disease resistance protein RGA1 n=1 Tax=Cocos nucifera TaxID=13894 RepID=A0A8K0I7V5_COCNU|nr:putative disease resistance protein RGA1 [Cocos nucifera]
MYDADDIIDECRIEGWKVQSSKQLQPLKLNTPARCHSFLFPCFSRVAFHHEIGKKIKDLNIKLEDISKERQELQLVSITGEQRNSQMAHRICRETSSEYLESDIVGIDEEASNLVQLLMDRNRGRNLVYAIVGMGGIGKTTLAQKIFSTEQIRAHFDIKICVCPCVSQDFVGINLLKQIIRCAGGDFGDAKTKAELGPLVRKALGQKRFFLVLDDIWSERVWEDFLRGPLLSGAADSRTLVTTQNEAIAKQMGAVYCHSMKQLSVEHGWLMLCRRVFSDSEVEDIKELKDVGMKIVRKCNGIPLAIETISGVLKTKERNNREWEKVLLSQTWTFNELPHGIMPVLYLGYEDLPSHLKQCFIYCSLFPENYEYSRMQLTQMWIAEGFVQAKEQVVEEDLADNYYSEVVTRSLLQITGKGFREMDCKMHDLLQSLALFVAQHEYFSGDPQHLETTLVKPCHLSL